MARPLRRPRRRVPRQDRSRALVDSIVEAASQLLRRGEDEGELSIRSIADRAGVGIGSIYQYFSDRDGIFEALLERLTEQNFERFCACFEGLSEDTLDTMFEGVLEETLDVYIKQSSLTRSAVRTILQFGHLRWITAERDRFVSRIADRTRCELPNVDPEVVTTSVRAVTDMTMGVVVSELYRPPDAARLEASRQALRRLIRTESAFLRRQNLAAVPDCASASATASAIPVAEEPPHLKSGERRVS